MEFKRNSPKTTSIDVYGHANKTAQTITAENVTATYGDTGKSVSASVTEPTTGGGALSYAVKSGDAVTVDNSGNLTIVKAGTAVITVTAAETDTYAQATKDVTVTVNTKAMTVSAEDVNVTADGQPHGITVNVTDPSSGATVKYGTEESSCTLDASPTQTEVGTKTVYYQVTADNYTTYTGSATVTVSDKSTQTITASDVTATFGETGKKVEATTNGNGAISYAVKEGSANYIDVDASTGALTIKKVGTATVVVTAAETDTYTQATKEVTVTINKASAVAATVTANNRTYDGTDKPLVNVTSEATGGTMQYALGTKDAATEEYTTFIPTATNVGTYYVWYKAIGDESHSDSSPVCLTVKIKEVHTHKFEHFEEKDSTYTESGYKAHYECTECGMWAEDAYGVHIYTEEEKQKLIIPPKTRPSDSDSDTDNSDGSNMGSRDSRDSSSGKSSSTSAEVQAMVDEINNVTSGNVPENHQAETGVAASDVGGKWANEPNADTWTYTKSDGTLAKSEWMSLDYNGLRYWYYFNEDGNMQTNWFDYKGERFYLMPEKDGWRGRMATGWKNIENKWYYFDIVPGSSQGRLYRSSVTPDGHTVGADGAWNGVGATPVGQK